MATRFEVDQIVRCINTNGTPMIKAAHFSKGELLVVTHVDRGVTADLINVRRLMDVTPVWTTAILPGKHFEAVDNDE